MQNLSVLKRVGDEKKAEWAHHYIKVGLDGNWTPSWVINMIEIWSISIVAVEKALEESAGQYCVGDEVSIADCCLVPQIYNARRYDSK